MTGFEFCSFNIWSYRITEQTWAQSARFSGMNANLNFDQNLSLFVCVRLNRREEKKNRLDRDNLETETPLAQVLWVTSWFQPAENQWGLGRPPVCFQGNRALSPPPPHKTSHSLSLCLCPCLSLSLSLTRSHVLSWRCWGGGRWWGDSLQHHCHGNEERTKRRGEKENGNFHRWRRDGNGCHDLCFKTQNGNFNVVLLILKYFFTKNSHFYLPLPIPIACCTTSSSSSFLLCLSFPAF